MVPVRGAVTGVNPIIPSRAGLRTARGVGIILASRFRREPGLCPRLTSTWGHGQEVSPDSAPQPLSPSPASVPCSSGSLRFSAPQVSIRLDGENKAVEYDAVGAMKDAVRVVFRGPRVGNLFDRDWHKVALSIQAQNVSLYVDCALVQTLPIEERENIDIQGKTVIGKRLYDSVPIDVSTGEALYSQGPGVTRGSLGTLVSPSAPHRSVSFIKTWPWTPFGGRTPTRKPS